MKIKRITLKRFLRQVHYWISLGIMVPSGIIIAAGIFLMLKKEIGWIQPPAQKGAFVYQLPAISYEDMLASAKSQPQVGIQSWKDVNRVDIRPKTGMAKITSQTGWEVQVDTSNGNVLSTAYRRSDVIESIHDGSFFASWVKLYIFLPTGILLLLMWGTGIYLFITTELAKFKKRRRKPR